MQTLRRDPTDERRFAVAGRPMHAGDVLELQVADAVWVPARFEWSHGEGGPRGYFELGLPGGGSASVDLALGASVRWPEHRAVPEAENPLRSKLGRMLLVRAHGRIESLSELRSPFSVASAAAAMEVESVDVTLNEFWEYGLVKLAGPKHYELTEFGRSIGDARMPVLDVEGAVDLLVEFGSHYACAQDSRCDPDQGLRECASRLLALLTDSAAEREDIEAVLPFDVEAA